MKQAPTMLRKKALEPVDAPSTGPTSLPVNPEALSKLLAAPAIGEPAPLEAPPARERHEQARPGRQKRDTPKRRADRADGEELRRVQVYLSPEVEEGLRVLAVRERKSLSAIVDGELRGLLKRRGAL